MVRTVGLVAAAATVAATFALDGPRRAFGVEPAAGHLTRGIAYSPYREGQSPGGVSPGEGEILEDLRLLAGRWPLLRMYDANAAAATTLRLIRTHRLPLRLILGAWLGPEPDATTRTANRGRIDAAIQLSRQYPDLVLAVHAGNETQVSWTDHPLPAAKLINYLRELRAAVSQPVSTADDFKFWLSDAAPAVAAECDFIMLHAYPAWNGVALAEAVPWTADVYRRTLRRFPAHPVILAETGWPTRHDPTRQGPGEEGSLIKGETSPAAQASYLKQHYAWADAAGVVTLLFEAFDESWKGRGAAGGPDEAEKNWGVFTADRRPKPAVSALPPQPAAAPISSAPRAPSRR